MPSTFSSVVMGLSSRKQTSSKTFLSGCRDEVFEDGKIRRHIYSFTLHASCQERKMTPFLLHSLKYFKCPTLVTLRSKLICCILSFGSFPGSWISCIFVSAFSASQFKRFQMSYVSNLTKQAYLLYSFFWVFPRRLNFMYLRFGLFCFTV